MNDTESIWLLLFSSIILWVLVRYIDPNTFDFEPSNEKHDQNYYKIFLVDRAYREVMV